MWNYAQLSQIAKKCVGPVGLVAAIATSCLACGIVIGTAGTQLVQKVKKENTIKQEASEKASEE